MTESRTLAVARRELAGLGAPDDLRGSESSFRELLRAFMRLEYEPGEMVSERELMERTSSSRTALRQAIARLSELGLVTPMARKGLMVTPIDVLDVSTVYDARLAIERGVVRLAAQRATPQQVRELQHLAASASGRAKGTGGEFVERDMALHLAIASASRNRYLRDALTRILPLSARLWHRLYREIGTDQRFMFEHGQIIEAIAKRDPDAAEAAAIEHLESARESLATVFTPAVDRGAE